MPVLLPVKIAFKGATKQNRARLLVWNVYLENTKQKLKNKNVKNAKLVELLQAQVNKITVKCVERVNIKIRKAKHCVWPAFQEDTKQEQNR
jgi:hypothetical protein